MVSSSANALDFCQFSLFSNILKQPMLILGSHELKGKSVNLKEHFTVLEKNYGSELNDLLSYIPVGIIKKKLLFSNYPKIIMK